MVVVKLELLFCSFFVPIRYCCFHLEINFEIRSYRSSVASTTVWDLKLLLLFYKYYYYLLLQTIFIIIYKPLLRLVLVLLVQVQVVLSMLRNYKNSLLWLSKIWTISSADACGLSYPNYSFLFYFFKLFTDA